MEDSCFLGQMMQTDEAVSVRFVMECFLLLDPEDLKAADTEIGAEVDVGKAKGESAVQEVHKP